MVEQCRFRNTSISRGGLYLMVFCALIGGREGLHRIKEVKSQVGNLEQSVKSIQVNMPVLRQENGQRFYEINGTRAYVEIDGKPAESYSTNGVFSKE